MGDKARANTASHANLQVFFLSCMVSGLLVELLYNKRGRVVMTMWSSSGQAGFPNKSAYRDSTIPSGAMTASRMFGGRSKTVTVLPGHWSQIRSGGEGALITSVGLS